MRHGRNVLALIALSLVFTAGCKKKEGAAKTDDSAAAKPAGEAPAAAGGKTYTCTKPGWCTHYSGDALVLGDAALKGSCEAMSGAFAEGTCPAEKSLGTCDIGQGQVRTYYPTEGDMGMNADNAKSDCGILDGKFAAAM